MPQARKRGKHIDFMLLAVVTTLLAFGVVSVYSASYADSLRAWKDPTWLFERQLIWATIGVVAMTVTAAIDYSLWRRLAIPIMAVALIGLVLVLMLGSERFGAQRQLLNGSVQPSELTKVAVIIYIAAWLSSRRDKLSDVRLGLVPFAVLLGIITTLLAAEPDISTAVVIAATAMTMFFIAGADLRQIFLAILIAALTFGVLITQSGHARQRVEDYLEFLHDPAQGGSEQARKAIVLLAQGGPFGVGGPGASQLDPQASIPVGWSDAILAIVGRDLGLIGTLLVIGLFAGLMWRGFQIALTADDVFGMLLASGVTFWLVFQAAINIGVITAMIPFTGMPLPFISYGGSSLVTSLIGIGLLLSVSRGTSRREAQSANLAIRWGYRRPRVSRASDRQRPGRRATGRRAASRTGRPTSTPVRRVPR